MNTHDNNTNETEAQISGICDNYIYEIYKDRVIVRSIEWLSADENQLWIEEPLHKEISLTAGERYVEKELSKISTLFSQHVAPIAIIHMRERNMTKNERLLMKENENLIQSELDL